MTYPHSTLHTSRNATATGQMQLTLEVIYSDDTLCVSRSTFLDEGNILFLLQQKYGTQQLCCRQDISQNAL